MKKRTLIIGIAITLLFVLSMFSVSLAKDIQLPPGQKLALVDGSYLTMQGAVINLVQPGGKMKSFPQGSKIQCDDSGHVTIWGTGGTAIWGTGGTAITKSDLCLKIVKSGQVQEPARAQKFEDPTFKRAPGGGTTNPQPTVQSGGQVGRAGAIIEPDILRQPKPQDPAFQPKAPAPGGVTNPQPAK